MNTWLPRMRRTPFPSLAFRSLANITTILPSSTTIPVTTAGIEVRGSTASRTASK